MISSELQRKILSECSFHKDGARYSDIQLDLDHDLFNYHLKELIKKELIKKDKDRYILTLKGKSLVTNIDERDLNVPTTFKVSVYIAPVVDGKILLTRRLKHPQYGYVGLIAEKRKYGEKILDNALRALIEETGLRTDSMRIIGNLHQIRRNKEGDVIEDGIFYVCYTNRVEGKLIERSQEGEYFWVNLKDVKTLDKLFKPSVEVIVDEIVKRLEGGFDDMFIYEFLPDPEEY